MRLAKILVTVIVGLFSLKGKRRLKTQEGPFEHENVGKLVEYEWSKTARQKQLVEI